ncbi:IS607 family element RNA-guided endonuclease TnpB [Kitasatospora sp. NPDC048538]|uniref:IS607 family element RNA-guided endonuclease TnpB n=1 Tax=unclassified Kitasatospora TaxID=2633591 RepID=UPI0033C5F5E6
MIVTHAYRFALDPTPRQAHELLRHCGAARVAFNWALAQVKANLSQREAERSYGLAGDDLTPVFGWSMYSMRKAWNLAKDDAAPWWRECSKEAYATGLEQLATGLRNWSDSRRGKRRGPVMGFPHFKSKHKAAKSCRFTTGAIRLEDDRRHVTLPVLGTLRTHENTRKLHRRIANGTARLKSATVRLYAGRWHVSFTVEVERGNHQPSRPGAVVGVDLGIRTLAVFSDGRPAMENPKHYDAACRKLARLSRTVARRVGPDRIAGQRPSKRWLKANDARNRVHHRVAALRRDAIHKLTTELAREYGTIVVEDLNVAGMLKNHRLARAVADAGFGEIRRQLSYKTAWNGGQLEVADRWFPSSKTCSGCQAVKSKLPLRVRTFVCERCGLVIDRDENAALNLAAMIGRRVAGSGPETGNGSPSRRKTRLCLADGAISRQGQEASTPHRSPVVSSQTVTFVHSRANR